MTRFVNHSIFVISGQLGLCVCVFCVIIYFDCSTGGTIAQSCRRSFSFVDSRKEGVRLTRRPRLFPNSRNYLSKRDRSQLINSKGRTVKYLFIIKKRSIFFFHFFFFGHSYEAN